MTRYFFNGQEVSEEELQRRCMSDEEAAERKVLEICLRLGVSEKTALAILYLRTRSRWTQEKEDELVARDLAGNPISLNTVLSGEF